MAAVTCSNVSESVETVAMLPEADFSKFTKFMLNITGAKFTWR